MKRRRTLAASYSGLMGLGLGGAGIIASLAP